MKKKKTKIPSILIIIIFIVSMIIVSLVCINKNWSLPNVFIKDGSLLINNFMNNLDNQALVNENEELKIYKNENEELKTEIKKLKNSLKLESLLSDKSFIHASVVNRNLDYWNESLIIDKGKNAGIKKDMAVVNNGYLIGIISDVTQYNSTVSLLCNKKFTFNFSVKLNVNDKYVYGILDNYKDGYFEVMGIVENIDIPSNTTIETSGLSKIIPSGLAVGKVHDILTDNFDLSKIVRVTPGVNFDDISYVTVIKGDL